MERRVFIAILLSFVVIYAYQALFLPPPSPPQRAATTQPSTQARPAPGAVERPEPDQAPAAPPVEVVVSEPSEREVVVETDTVEAVFTNRGGRLVHWRLKHYRDATGKPVDMVPSEVPAEEPRPFSLEVDDAQLTARLNTALYRVSGDTQGRVDATSQPATVAFEYQDAAGLQARKEFRFEPGGYIVTFSAAVSNGGQPLNPVLQWGPGLDDAGAISGGGSFFTANYVQPPEAIYHLEGDVERLRAGDVTEDPVHEGRFRFAGVDDHYFLAAAIDPGQARLEYRALTLPGEGDRSRQFMAHAIRFPQAPSAVRYFVGPKQFDILREVDPELVRAINFGIFAWLVIWLLGPLKWLYGVLGNYGWAIVVLTIFINLLMAPFRHKSVVAMRKMQEIQPQMKAIQERYAHLKMSDPARQKMNTEIMNLYREKGVNPASGCVPMLLTMPVLLAFYSMLSMSIELRDAPFTGWIRDLSAADPYFVLPALMGVSMFWQQRITPTTADPTQQRVMMVMPVLFTVMMAFAPSGVVLYWFVSQLWAIGQQYFTNWLIGPPVVAAARPPAERRLKSAGSGKSPGAAKRS
ncbi:MAG TPA: membrane protein insertase YidC [Vicinamibacterales bacterium]|nr:membrane protein insertase YidC [Vicinamibacterales bacterium]